LEGVEHGGEVTGGVTPPPWSIDGALDFMGRTRIDVAITSNAGGRYLGVGSSMPPASGPPCSDRDCRRGIRRCGYPLDAFAA
jgi:hypothetical protein